MTTHKAIVINQYWAGIISTLLGAFIIGSAGTALTMYSQVAVAQEKIVQLEQAKLPSRLDKLEEKVESTKQSVDEIRRTQNDMSKKIDLLVQDVVRRDDRRSPP